MMMKLHEPTTAELWNVGLEILENGADGIQCFVDLENSQIVAEITKADEVKKIGYRLPYPTGNTETDIKTLESKLSEEIRVSNLLDRVLEKAKMLA